MTIGNVTEMERIPGNRRIDCLGDGMHADENDHRRVCCCDEYAYFYTDGLADNDGCKTG